MNINMVNNNVVVHVCKELSGLKYFYKELITGVEDSAKRYFPQVSDDDIKESVKVALDLVFKRI